MFVLALLLQSFDSGLTALAQDRDPVDVLREAADVGYEATYKRLLKLGATELAERLKKAVYCGDCGNGKVKCGDCGGRGRRDLPCGRCRGAGRHKPDGGVVGDVDVTVKCRNCDGLKVFKNAGCPGCGRSGFAACGTCQGAPWRDRHCALKECRQGKVPCPECEGKGKIRPVCGVCAGEKRVGASVSVKCRGCDGKGRAAKEQPCGTCAGKPEGLGRVRCEGKGFTLKLDACPPCGDCFRLGVRISVNQGEAPGH